MSEPSIRLSEKHGVNPCIPVCFWCQKQRNEVALLGRLPDDRQAPISAILDYEPCGSCQANMDRGIAIFEALDKPVRADLPPIQRTPKLLYPTGTWCVVQREAFERLDCIKPREMKESILAQGKFFIEPAAWDALGLRRIDSD